MKVYNIGYERRRIDAFCDLLRTAGVEVLVDIRERAWSNRPEFRKQALRAALATAGIDYVHLKAAGNPFRPQNGHSSNFEECRLAYSKYLGQNRNVVSEAFSLARKHRSAFFCYEAERCRCHRDVLLEEFAKSEDATLEIVDL